MKSVAGVEFGMSPQRLYESRVRIAAGSEAWLSHFVEAHVALVYSIAREYLAPPYLLRELMSVGNVGLLCALEVVTSQKESTAFYTVVGGEIRNAIQRYVESSHRVKRVPYLYLGHHRNASGGIPVLSIRLNANQRCELRIGDGVCTVDHHEIESVGALNKLLADLRHGDLFAMEYVRGGVRRHTFINCE